MGVKFFLGFFFFSFFGHAHGMWKFPSQGSTTPQQSPELQQWQRRILNHWATRGLQVFLGFGQLPYILIINVPFLPKWARTSFYYLQPKCCGRTWCLSGHMVGSNWWNWDLNSRVQTPESAFLFITLNLQCAEGRGSVGWLPSANLPTVM